MLQSQIVWIVGHGSLHDETVDDFTSARPVIKLGHFLADAHYVRQYLNVVDHHGNLNQVSLRLRPRWWTTSFSDAK